MFEGLTVHEAVEEARKLYLPYPNRVPREFKQTGLTPGEYKEAYEAWEKARTEYEKAMASYEKRYSEVNDALEDLIKTEAGFEKVPEASRGKVWALAWENGHSSGYLEVYYQLIDLVALF